MTSEPNIHCAAALGDLPERTDRELMVRAHEGDALASLALVDRYAGPLLNLALRATGMRVVAEEAARDALASAIAGLAVRVPPADRRWIVDLAGDLYRRLLATGLKADRPARRVRISPRQWETERLALSPTARPSPRRAAQKLRQRLWRAYSMLPMRDRFVLALTEMAQLSSSELAAALGESQTRARAVRDEAKLTLMSRLTARGPRWSDRLARRGRRRRP